MNSDGLKANPSRKGWLNQYKRNANPELQRTSRQSNKGTETGWKLRQGTAVPPKASLVPNTQMYTDRYAITTLIARYEPLFGDIVVDGFNLHALVYTPSTRLRCRINVVFEADVDLGTSPTFLVIPTWNVTNMARNPASGRESSLQQLYPQQVSSANNFPFASQTTDASGVAPLPDAFTIDNAGELVRVNAHLDNGQFNDTVFGGSGGVNTLLIVTWEPNVGIQKDELASFYRDCKVAYGFVPTILKTPA
jgi:hypothetical protein